MAAFNNKQMKIRVLSERADKEELEREELENQGLADKEIDEMLKLKKTQGFKPTYAKAPYQENEKVIKNLGATNLGLPATHLIKSSTKTMYEEVDKKFTKTKMKQKLGDTQKGSGGQEEVDPLDEKKMLEQTKYIKEQNFSKDHLHDMLDGLKDISKTKGSHYGENYTFTQNMQEECDNQNFDHHLRKNDLKWYAEAYVKYKGTMRK